MQQFDPAQRRQAIQAFMTREGIDEISPWEKASELGSGTLRKFMNGETDSLTDRTYVRLALGAAKITGRSVEISELQGHFVTTDTSSNHIDSASLGDNQKLIPAPPRPASVPKHNDEKIPIMGTSLAGSEGDFQLNDGEPYDRVPTPQHLKDRRGLFILYVEGESMVPWKRPRQVVWLDPRIRPRPDDHVVVELRPTPPYEDRPAFLKLLVRQTGSKLILEQYNPKRTIELPLSRVHKVYRVMTEEEVMGIGVPLF